jgi:thiol-disulfide isomerase/thioredoxin
MSKERPRVILFFMKGCPHCERTWPAWDKAKKQLRESADVEEKESAEVSPDDGVSSFPTIVVLKNEEEVKRIEGARENPKALLKELGLRASRRSRTRGRRTYRRRRQLTKRTLRNYKAL